MLGNEVGKPISKVDLLDLIPPQEGMITQYYGRIGQGKTYAGTKDVLDDLRAGRIVYTNWKIDYKGFDDRKSLRQIIYNILFFKKEYFVIPENNLRHIEVDETFHKVFSTITDAKVYLDEGHVVFDSYKMAKMGMEERKNVLHTRHFNRSINIISQRPTAIHVSLRANVNRFYKCEKILSWPFIVFRRTEFQDMTDENVDEDDKNIISIKYYLGRSKVFESYDSRYLRGNLVDPERVKVDVYRVSYFDNIKLLFSNIRTSMNKLYSLVIHKFRG